MGINNAPININDFEPEIVEFPFPINLHMVVSLTVNIINRGVQRRVADDYPPHNVRFPIHTQTFCTPSPQITSDEQLSIRLHTDCVRRGDVRQVGACEDSGAHETHSSVRGLQVSGTGTREIGRTHPGS